jgi:peroxiredoxin
MACALPFSACGVINEELPTYEDTSIVREGDTAPDFTITLIDGRDVTLSDMRGDVVLLIFFSHTCPDCKNLFEDLHDSKEEFYAIDTQILTISRGGTTSEVEEYFAANGYTFDCAVDANKSIYSLYATMYVPRTYLINREGVVDLTTVEYSPSHIEQLLSCATQL